MSATQPPEVLPLRANSSNHPNSTMGQLDGPSGDDWGGAPSRSTTEVLVIASLLATIVVVTIGGNLLVIATVWTNRKMHNITNYFLVSLATTDLLLGCVVLPLSVVNTLSPYWPLGAVFCNIYISCDVMLCTVSILTLFVISLDRYFAVTTPLRYQGRMTSRIVWRVSAGIWMFSFVMAFLPIHFGWNSPDLSVQNWIQPYVCSLALNRPYVLLISLGTYFAPLIIMSAVYVRVLQITRMQVKEINKLGRLAMTPSKRSHENRIGRLRKWLDRSPSSPSSSSDHHHHHHHHHPHTLQDRRTSADHLPTSSHSAAIVSDRKAIVNLASIVLAFAICWIPYFVLFTLKPFVDLPLTSGFGYHFEMFALWLGYANSSINPFLYAFYNSSFRNGFRRLLCSRWARNRNGSLGLRSCDGDWDWSRGATTATGNGKSPEGRTTATATTRGSGVEDGYGNGLGLKVGAKCFEASGCGVERARTSMTLTDPSRTDYENLQQARNIERSRTLQEIALAKGIESSLGVERRTSGVMEKNAKVPCRRYVLLRCFESRRQRRQRNLITMTQRTSWNLASYDTKVSVV